MLYHEESLSWSTVVSNIYYYNHDVGDLCRLNTYKVLKMRKMRNLSCCAAACWLFTSFSFGAVLELELSPAQRAPCLGNLTLSCSFASEEQVTAVTMYWFLMVDLAEQKMCEVKDGVVNNTSRRATCTHAPPGRLHLTLHRAGPLDTGTYFCKLRSSVGFSLANTTVTPAECPGTFQHVTLQKPLRQGCVFNGVYPAGAVHWFSRDRNVTSLATEDVSSEGGLYNIGSVIPSKELDTPLNCSLWVPSAGNPQGPYPTATTATAQ
ncbi:uncharacterized protein LOC114794481 [Denticeps clupeoides]|uniref:uncharacterized protein LOC114794481 n=1 Tax=Denticeps clupeoides TaxID=299321 RepID=UPI0010A575EC|nr:uncharacterized protein LOC114794481 [Denticeps clupeoides]